jgi:hypothetical protein
MGGEVKFYVYVDRREDDQEPFYVGKGRLNRTHDFKRRNHLWRDIASKHGIKREIVLETLDEQLALDEEIRLIFKLKTRDYFGGANMCDGGKGPPGYRHTKSIREVLSVMSRNRLRMPEERRKASEKFLAMWQENRAKLMMTHARGVTHGRSRLIEADVIRVRAAYAQLDKSVRGAIADFYRRWSQELHVTSENLFRIVHRKSWQHLP